DGALQAVEGALPVLGGQAVDVVLEGVWDEAALDPHPGLPLVVEPLVEGAVEEVVVVGVVAELHVPADVPGEALGVHVARRQAARPIARLDHRIVAEPALLESVGGAQPSRAGAEDHDRPGIGHPRGVRPLPTATTAVWTSAR